MRIAMSGASGFVGSALSRYLSDAGHTVVALGRELFEQEESDSLCKAIADCDAIINLAGAPISSPWTKSHKEEILTSRICTTRRLVEAANRTPSLSLFISTSAVGIYPEQGCHTEASQATDDDFLSDVCRMWEAQTNALARDKRLIITRFGVVLSPNGGALQRILRTVSYGFLALIADPKTGFSWIDLDDLCRAERHLAESPEAEGIYNLCAPQKTSWGEFMRSIAVRKGIKYTIRIPDFLLRIVLGESATALVKNSCVQPEKLVKSGFEFESPTIRSFAHNKL